MKSPKGNDRRDEEPANNRKPANYLVTNDFPIAQGKVSGNLRSVLVNTCCNEAVVKQSLVCNDELMGKVGKLTLLDRSVIEGVSHITIYTPLYEGRVEALCIDNPMFNCEQLYCGCVLVYF